MQKLAYNTEGKTTNAITIKITDVSIRRSKLFLSTLVEQYNANEIWYQKKIAAVAHDFIVNRLKIVDQQLVELENILEDFKLNNRITNVETQGSMMIEKEVMYNDKLFDLDTQEKILLLILEYINRTEEGHRIRERKTL